MAGLVALANHASETSDSPARVEVLGQEAGGVNLSEGAVAGRWVDDPDLVDVKQDGGILRRLQKTHLLLFVRENGDPQLLGTSQTFGVLLYIADPACRRRRTLFTSRVFITRNILQHLFGRP